MGGRASRVRHSRGGDRAPLDAGVSVDLAAAREKAWAPVEVSDDWDELRRLVLALCDEVEQLRAPSQ